MSDSLSIAAVSETLRNLLAKGLNDILLNENQVTTKPLDKAREDAGEAKQVNLFLYQTATNAAFQNMDMPGRVRPGESGHPPLALQLYYLLTAYGESDDDLRGDGHRLLGRAMSILHDHPVLSREEIRSSFPESDLSEQFERVRIIPHFLSLDDISKLWNAFQTQYRISAAYQVSVVLIDSTRAIRTPIPVLSRGDQNQGVIAVAQPSPTISQIRLPRGKPGAELGDELIIRGSNLDDPNVQVRFHHSLLKAPLELKPSPMEIVVEGQPEHALSVRLPNVADDPQVPGKWPIGFYTLTLVVKRPNLPSWTTNALSFALIPTTTLALPAAPPIPPEVPEGDVNVRITCVPQVRPGQRVELLFGDRVILADPVAVPASASEPSQLNFTVEDAVKGNYVLRVRIHGVDSVPVDFSKVPPEFDPKLQLIVKVP